MGRNYEKLNMGSKNSVDGEKSGAGKRVHGVRGTCFED